MIEAVNLTKTYKVKHGESVTALDGVNLKFGETGMIFVVGESGSGKSTLLHLLGGLDMYDGGEIIVNGKSTRNFSETEWNNYRSNYVGFVFQEYNLLSDFTVKDNLAVVDEIQNKSTADGEIERVLSKVGLDGMEKRKPKQLSGGQKQRVAIARAIIKNPSLILADEPTGALDGKNGRSVISLLKDISKETLVIVVTHDMNLAKEFGDRIIEISDGKIVNDIEQLPAIIEQEA